MHLFSVLELSLTPYGSPPPPGHNLAAKAPYKALQGTPFKKTLSSEVQAGSPLDLLETHVHRGMWWRDAQTPSRLYEGSEVA